MGSMIEFARPDGGRTRGYLASAGTGNPGVVVIQEWWGLNDQICGVVDRLARAGFNALAPDLFEGTVTAKRDEASHLMDGLDFSDATHQDIRGAVLHLKSLSGKVAALGFCMGGALTVAAAVHVPQIDASVCFYGLPPKEFADPAKIRMPVQGHFAKKDDWITPEKVEEFEAALKRGGAKYEIHRYDAAHAFFNEHNEGQYDVRSAKLAWERTIRFLHANLRP